MVRTGSWHHAAWHRGTWGDGTGLLTLVLLLHHQIHVVHASLDVVPRNKLVLLCVCLVFQLHQLIEIPAPSPNNKDNEVPQNKRDLQVPLVGDRNEKTWGGGVAGRTARAREGTVGKVSKNTDS